MLKNLGYTAYCADPHVIDVSMSGINKVRARSFANSADGWRHRWFDGDHEHCFR